MLDESRVLMWPDQFGLKVTSADMTRHLHMPATLNSVHRAAILNQMELFQEAALASMSLCGAAASGR